MFVNGCWATPTIPEEVIIPSPSVMWQTPYVNTVGDLGQGFILSEIITAKKVLAAYNMCLNIIFHTSFVFELCGLVLLIWLNVD